MVESNYHAKGSLNDSFGRLPGTKKSRQNDLTQLFKLTYPLTDAKVRNTYKTGGESSSSQRYFRIKYDAPQRDLQYQYQLVCAVAQVSVECYLKWVDESTIDVGLWLTQSLSSKNHSFVKDLVNQSVPKGAACLERAVRQNNYRSLMQVLSTIEGIQVSYSCMSEDSKFVYLNATNKMSSIALEELVKLALFPAENVSAQSLSAAQDMAVQIRATLFHQVGTYVTSTIAYNLAQDQNSLSNIFGVMMSSMSDAHDQADQLAHFISAADLHSQLRITIEYEIDQCIERFNRARLLGDAVAAWMRGPSSNKIKITQVNDVLSQFSSEVDTFSSTMKVQAQDLMTQIPQLGSKCSVKQFQLLLSRQASRILEPSSGFLELDEMDESGVAQLLLLADSLYKHVLGDYTDSNWASLLIIGEPGTGKSSILDAIKLFLGGVTVNPSAQCFQLSNISSASCFILDEYPVHEFFSNRTKVMFDYYANVINDVKYSQPIEKGRMVMRVATSNLHMESWINVAKSSEEKKVQARAILRRCAILNPVLAVPGYCSLLQASLTMNRSKVRQETIIRTLLLIGWMLHHRRVKSPARIPLRWLQFDPSVNDSFYDELYEQLTVSKGYFVLKKLALMMCAPNKYQDIILAYLRNYHNAMDVHRNFDLNNSTFDCTATTQQRGYENQIVSVFYCPVFTDILPQLKIDTEMAIESFATQGLLPGGLFAPFSGEFTLGFYAQLVNRVEQQSKGSYAKLARLVHSDKPLADLNSLCDFFISAGKLEALVACQFRNYIMRARLLVGLGDQLTQLALQAKALADVNTDEEIGVFSLLDEPCAEVIASEDSSSSYYEDLTFEKAKEDCTMTNGGIPLSDHPSITLEALSEGTDMCVLSRPTLDEEQQDY